MIEYRQFDQVLPSVEGRTLSGVLVRYDTPARVNGLQEIFRPGAFGDVGSLDLILNSQHNRSAPLSRSPMITLTDSPTELRVDAYLIDTSANNDVLAMVQAGILKGFSVEMRVTDDTISGGKRYINRAELVGMGIVDRPAHPNEVTVRSADDRSSRIHRYTRI